ncbi:MAG: hypothetical protein ACTHOK_01635 [Nocardioidaceae bacterium]
MNQREAVDARMPGQRTGRRDEGLPSRAGVLGVPRRIPILPRTFLPRTRLYEGLEAAAAGAVTLLVAPAGAGKTLGAAGWLHHTRRAATTIWIEADRSCTAEQLAAVLDHGASTSDGADREDHARAGPVVLDNAQDLPSATIRYLDRRLNDDPQGMRVLLLSRRDVPLTGIVPQLLGHLNVLRGDVLRLDDDEVARLVADHARTGSAFVAQAITDRSGGWCAAAVLMSRAIGACPDKEAAARRFQSAGPPALDQAVGEVFAALGPRERHLLLCSTAEPSLTAQTARHLTADPNAGQVLVDLEATGLLVSSHVDTSTGRRGGPALVPTYTVHPLLREVARRRLQVGGVDVQRARSTVARAVRLDLTRGPHRYALARLTAVGAHADAARLLSSQGSAIALRGQGGLVAGYASAHPDVVEQEPDVWTALALDRWIQADVTAARRWIDRIIARRAPSTSDVLDACAWLLDARGSGPARSRRGSCLGSPRAAAAGPLGACASPVADGGARCRADLDGGLEPGAAALEHRCHCRSRR